MRLKKIQERLRVAKNIVLHKLGTRKTSDGTFTVYDYEKNPDGRPNMFTVLEDKDGWVVTIAFVPPEMQGLGISKDFHIEMNTRSIKTTGNPLKSSNELSNDGIKFWDALVKKGYAIKHGDKDYSFIHKIFEDFIPVKVDQYGKYIIWENGDYMVSVNDPGYADYVSLWFKGKKVGEQTTTKIAGADKNYLGLRGAEIDRKHQGQGFFKVMLRALMDNMNKKYKGLVGYVPDLASSKTINFFNKYGNVDGDYYYLERDTKI